MTASALSKQLRTVATIAYAEGKVEIQTRQEVRAKGRRVKISGNWKDAVKLPFTKSRPPDGWPKPKD